MVQALTLLSVVLLSFSEVVLATSNPCIALDWKFNLFAFGLNGKDYSAGNQSTWTSATPAKDITSSGRPPFDGPNPKCFLAQYQDTAYVLGADTANPASVYMYNFLAKSWSQQVVKTNGFNPASWNGILDHDTNVIFAISSRNLYTLSLGEQVEAQSTPLTWQSAGMVPYPSSYNPVMSIANNHISFFDVPGVPAGSADLYVIHFSYWQPQTQTYPLVSGSGSSFPASQGKATSFFQTSIDNVQQEIAFIPQGAANTYVVNVLTNTTQKLAGPTNKDSTSQYFAGPTALVQLAGNGVVYFLPYEEGNDSANAAAKWSKVKSLLGFAPTKSTKRDMNLDMDLVKRSGATTHEVGSLYTISRVLSAGLVLSGVFCLV